MRVLVGCEYSGVVRDAFIARGHEAMSCDLLPTDRPGPHYAGDVFDVIGDGWDLGIFHPPCTFMANSGSRWLYNSDGTKDEARWDEMEEAANFFKNLLNADIPRVAVENPIMLGYAKDIIGVKQSQVVQPWMFGHGETKATCLWLRNLPELVPTDVVGGREARIHRLPPSEDRWKLRSTTFTGIAEAMAEQWGGLDD